MNDRGENLQLTEAATVIPYIDQPEVTAHLFHPEQKQVLTVPGIYSVSVDVEPGISIGGRLYPSEAESPIILFFHGNGEFASDYDSLAPLYTNMGISLLVMDYRGYGVSGGMPTGTTMPKDAVKCYESLDRICRDGNLVPIRRYVMGRSIGSAAAIEVAAKAEEGRIQGLIIDSGFAATQALLKRLGVDVPVMDEEKDGFNNVGKIRQVQAPVLIIHGAKDSLIPPSNAKELFARAGTQDKHLIMIPGAGHKDLLINGRQQYFQAIQQFTSFTFPNHTFSSIKI